MGRKKQQPEEPPAKEEPTRVSKADAIRQTIISLGGPDAIADNAMVIERVQQEYGLVIDSQEVSQYKTKMRKLGSTNDEPRKAKKPLSLAATIRPIKDAASALGGFDELSTRLAQAAEMENLAYSLGYDSVRALSEDVIELSQLLQKPL